VRKSGQPCNSRLFSPYRCEPQVTSAQTGWHSEAKLELVCFASACRRGQSAPRPWG
jgi:hypothetical protein